MLPLQARTVELWRERNPGLDTSPMEVVALVKRVRVLLDRAVEDLYDGAALTSAEVELLVPLRHADEPVTAARLAARLGMSRAGISKTLAKLEKRGLITRAANPADRRAALIRMTPEGEEVIDDLFPRELEAHGKLLAGLGADRRRVVDALTRFAEAMEAQLEE
ncbi:MarR family transcriptional regulator [Saccharopolyspora erythraea NRRL 2338]|uniref:MarR-family transcriptional regulator n=2 Tax=Saccharopolyspora erythraea TaxID=1836 RepID=A4F6G0_SACEN|nr:MarR family transcriptional regulator [Saccharopolyspora erythraea]EQD88135.1 transcriptional regulator [Saccharopolyspora erythraea D]PFG93437.1 MarR family transcriptional regulator [Saccharopolyspora erythraea NRRL 2338]QRK90310.1 MarR family transcriptional regulator [Saccharopolyspora erythraea]CAL99634.1 MarR-family transcriptional regulator [Saccharopolyspora erythraea NRRL 2338]